jgi:hypothetical protein
VGTAHPLKGRKKWKKSNTKTWVWRRFNRSFRGPAKVYRGSTFRSSTDFLSSADILPFRRFIFDKKKYFMSVLL